MVGGVIVVFGVQVVVVAAVVVDMVCETVVVDLRQDMVVESLVVLVLEEDKMASHHWEVDHRPCKIAVDHKHLLVEVVGHMVGSPGPKKSDGRNVAPLIVPWMTRVMIRNRDEP